MAKKSQKAWSYQKYAIEMKENMGYKAFHPALAFISRHSRSIFFYCLAAILLISLTPQLQTPRFRVFGNLFRMDRVVHMIVFFVPALLLVLWQKNKHKKIPLSKWILIGTLGIVIAFSVEAIQILIPARSFNLEDALYGVAGYFLGMMFLSLPIRPRMNYLNVAVLVVALFIICIL